MGKLWIEVKIIVRCTISTVMGKKRMRIADVVRATGLHRETVTKLYYDRKERFTKDLLDRLCKALDCKPQDLLEFVPGEEENCAR